MKFRVKKTEMNSFNLHLILLFFSGIDPVDCEDEATSTTTTTNSPTSEGEQLTTYYGIKFQMQQNF